MLPRHARCVLFRLRCNGHSLLLSSYLSRIGGIENPSCSADGHSSQDKSHLILHCPATDSLRRSLWRLSVSLQSLVQALGSCPDSGAPWSSVMPPSFGKGRVTTTKTTTTMIADITNAHVHKRNDLIISRRSTSQIYNYARFTQCKRCSIVHAFLLCF